MDAETRALLERTRGVLVGADRSGADPAEWPADLNVREFPDVANG